MEMAVWKAKVQGKTLLMLFEQKSADPKATKADEIDKHWKLHKDFEQITMV